MTIPCPRCGSDVVKLAGCDYCSACYSTLETPHQIEAWKPLQGYAGYFEISNLGRVRRFETREVIHKPRVSRS